MDLFDSSTWGGGISDLLLQPEVAYSGADPLVFAGNYVSWNFVNPPPPLLRIDLVFLATFTAEFTGLLDGSDFIVSDGNRQVRLVETAGKYYFDGTEVGLPAPADSHFVFRVISTGDSIDLYVAQSEPAQTGLQMVASIPEMTEVTTYPAGMHFTGQVGTLSQLAADSQPALPKRPPVAIIDGPAGPLKTNQSVGLSGERSYDPDGFPISFVWDISGPVAVRTSDSSYASAILLPATFTAVEPGAAGNGLVVAFTAADPLKSVVTLSYDEGTRTLTVTPGGGGGGDTWFDLMQQMGASLLDSFVIINVPDLLQGDLLPVSGGVTLYGGSDSTNSILAFSPPVVGIYIVTLSVFVRDGALLIFSVPATFKVTVAENTLLESAVPDGSRFWDLIPESFYKLWDDPQLYETFWSGLIQVYGAVLNDVWVENQRLSLQTIQDRVPRRWLPFPTRMLIERQFNMASAGKTMYGTVQPGGTIYLNAKGVADGPVSTNTLEDSTADFVALGVAEKAFVYNLTDGSSAEISSFNATSVTGTLQGGTGLWEPGDEYMVELRFPAGFRVIYLEERGSLHEVLRAPSGVAVLSPTPYDRVQVSQGIYGRVISGPTFYPTYGTANFADADITAGKAYISLNGREYQVVARNGDGFDLVGDPPLGRDFTWTAFVTRLDEVTLRVLSHISYRGVGRHGDVLETTDNNEWLVYGTINKLLAFDASSPGTTRKIRLRNAIPGYNDLVSVPRLKTVIAWNEGRLANGRKGVFSRYVAPGAIWTRFSAPNLPNNLDPLEKYELLIGDVRYSVDVATAAPDLIITDRLQERRNIHWQLKRQLSYVEFGDYQVGNGVIEFETPHDFPPLLWSEVSWFDDTARVRNSYGDIAGLMPEDVEGFSGGYSDAVRAVFYGLLTDSFVENVANAVALLIGIPVSFEEGIVTDIDIEFTPDTSRIEVTGDTVRVYLYPRGVAIAVNPLTEEQFVIGDQVPRFARLTEGVQVLDWVNAPVRFSALIASGLLHPFQERHYFEVHVDGMNFFSFDWAVQSAILCRLHPTHKWHRLIADVHITDTLSLTDYCRQIVTMCIIEDMHTDTSQTNQGQYATMSGSYDGAGQPQLFGVPDEGLDEHNRPIIPEYPNAHEYHVFVAGQEVIYIGFPGETFDQVLMGIRDAVLSSGAPYTGVQYSVNEWVIVRWEGGSATVDENVLNWWHTEYQHGFEEGDPLSGPHGIAGRLEMTGWEDFVEPWLSWYIREGEYPRADMGLVADSVDENGMPDDERGLFFWADEMFRTRYKVSGNVVYPDPNADLLNGWFVVYPYAGFVWDQTPRQVHRPYADQHVIEEKAYVDGVFIDPPYEATSPHYEFSLMSGSPTTMELENGAAPAVSGPVPTEDEANAVFTRLTQLQRFKFNGDSGFIRQLYVQPWFRNTPIPVVTSHDLGTAVDLGAFALYGRYFNDDARVFFGDLEATSIVVHRPILNSLTGTALGGGADFILLDITASGSDNFYDFWEIQITGGTGVGQRRLIIDYNGTLKQANVTIPWVTQPDFTSDYYIVRYGFPSHISGVVPDGPAASVVDVKVVTRGKHRTLVGAYTHT